MDAVTRLWEESYECCSIYDTIVRPPPRTASEAVLDPPEEEDELVGTEAMNRSQIAAIRSSLAPLSLIWGPPGKSLHLRVRIEAHWHPSPQGQERRQLSCRYFVISCAGSRTARFS